MLHPYRTIAWVVLVAIIGGSGCATLSSKITPEGNLRGRVKAYWEARQRADIHGVYELYSPAFKQKVSKEAFLRNYFRRLARFLPESISVESVSIDPSGQRAGVRVKLTIHMSVEGESLVQTAQHEEAWVYVEEKWWKETEPIIPNI